MGTSSPKPAGNLFFVKLGLGIGGTLCLILAASMFFMGQLSTKVAGAPNDNVIFFLILVVLGLGCFLAIEWYSARATPVATRRTRFEDEEMAVGPSPELLQALAAGAAEAQQEQNPPALAPDGTPLPATPGVISSSDGSVSMNHLESADFIYAKVFDLPSEEQVVQLIHKAVADLQAKGYSDKGLQGFTGKLAANLAKINPDQMPEQVAKNTQRAMQSLMELQRTSGSTA